MPIISSLRQEEIDIEEEIEKDLDEYHSTKKVIFAIEDSLVENRAKLSQVKESIRLYELANDFRSLIDETRESQISHFRIKMEEDNESKETDTENRFPSPSKI